MKSTYQPTLCPYCGKANELHASMRHGRTPQDGDFMLCVGCGQFAIYAGKALRKPNVFEEHTIQTDPALQNARALLNGMKKRHA